MRALVYNVRYSVVPIDPLLLTVTLYFWLELHSFILTQYIRSSSSRYNRVRLFNGSHSATKFETNCGLCRTSGFRRIVVAAYAFLGHQRGIGWCLPTFGDNLLIPSLRIRHDPWKLTRILRRVTSKKIERLKFLDVFLLTILTNFFRINKFILLEINLLLQCAG